MALSEDRTQHLGLQQLSKQYSYRSKTGNTNDTLSFIVLCSADVTALSELPLLEPSFTPKDVCKILRVKILRLSIARTVKSGSAPITHILL